MPQEIPSSGVTLPSTIASSTTHFCNWGDVNGAAAVTNDPDSVVRTLGHTKPESAMPCSSKKSHTSMMMTVISVTATRTDQVNFKTSASAMKSRNPPAV